MDKPKKWCPLLSITPTHQAKQTCDCVESQCAWWCDWDKCCALVAIPSEISDRSNDLIRTIEK